MDNNKTINTLLNAELPPSVDNALKNLTDKPSLTAGNIISGLLDIIFGQIPYWDNKIRLKREHDLEQYRQKLAVSIDNIPPEKLVEPSIRIATQALEDSKYCISEEELQNMFVSLISNSMNTDFSNYVHPSFSSIIKQMSALDARIISLFKNESLPGLPVCHYRVTFPGIAYSPSIPEHIFLEIPEADISPSSISLESLSHHGLISISYVEYLNDKTLYEKFYVHPFYRDLHDYCPVEDITVKKGIVNLTPLGRSFVKVCVPD